MQVSQAEPDRQVEQERQDQLAALEPLGYWEPSAHQGRLERQDLREWLDLRVLWVSLD